MRPWRFLICYFPNYLLGISAVYFFIFSAQYLQQSRVLFGGVLASMLFTFVFSWLYFRGVSHSSWRARVEVVAVWFGLTLLIDMAFLIFVHGKSVGDLGMLSVLSYALEMAILFLAAYVTANAHPQFAAPDLLMKQSESDEQA